MDTQGLGSAQQRIEDAMRRIEAACSPRPNAGAPVQRMAELASRHAALRTDMQRALDELNTLITGQA